MSAATAKCCLCGKPATQEYRPFCSRRCADIDLHRWFSGQYAAPVEEGADRPDDADDDRDDEPPRLRNN